MLWKWNVQNTEPTVPSTEKNNFLFEKIIIEYDDKKVKVDVYDTALGKGLWKHFEITLWKKEYLRKTSAF